MENYFEILSGCPLFHGIESSDFESMLKCLGAKTLDFSKGTPVFLEGSAAQYVGIVLRGAIQIIWEDYYGNRSVLTMLKPGELFAEAFSFAGLETMPVSAIATKDSTVLLLNCRRVVTVCQHTCRFHNRLLKNLLQGMAMKNLAMTQKIRYMSQKTTKEKLTSYLLDQAKQNESFEFTIPYDRQSLADYLGVERSAMSAEISKLKKSGQIDTKGSWFHIKELRKG
jgi:CRP-like cAMP-binding protein